MVKIDLITGFLGSGKTTFIKKYVKYLVGKGYNVGILENDYGAVNVDMMLLQDVMGPNCHAEMVAGGCGEDCHKRRFKTKLIAMGMSGYDRVIVEPSGIFDVDEFFDCLHEEPLDRWYEIGNIIAIVDSNLDTDMSKQSRYMLASQIADCGCLLVSKVDNPDDSKDKACIDNTIRFVNETLSQFHCKRTFERVPDSSNTQGYKGVIAKNWDELDDGDFERIMSTSYRLYDLAKEWFKQSDIYNSVYIMNKNYNEAQIREITERIFADKECGDVFRIKGFFKENSQENQGQWMEVNATSHRTEIKCINEGQDIIIIIGSNLVEKRIREYFED